MMPVEAKPARRNWKLIGGGVVIALALVWLILFVTVGGEYYETVDEVKATGQVALGRVGGRVASGSVQQGDGQVRFALESAGGEQLQVVYRGEFPERLDSYAQVVAAGSLGSEGTFEATEVLVKCPDKLFAEKVTNKVLGGTGLERLLY